MASLMRAAGGTDRPRSLRDGKPLLEMRVGSLGCGRCRGAPRKACSQVRPPSQHGRANDFGPATFWMRTFCELEISQPHISAPRQHAGENGRRAVGCEEEEGPH
jgi:hypothetical protein